MSSALQSAFVGQQIPGSRHTTHHARRAISAAPQPRRSAGRLRPVQPRAASSELPMGYGASSSQSFSIDMAGTGMDHIGQTGKVTVVGCGAVGMACASSIVSLNLCNKLMLIDYFAAKAKGEAMDLKHGSAFFSARMDINSSGDMLDARGSDVIVITAGARQQEGESRLSLIGRNMDIFKTIIPPLVQSSPNAILIIVSNPCDILTYAAWKISGLPLNQVFGSGTNLDSSRLKHMLALEAGVSESSVEVHVIGEHGDSSVACFAAGSIAGIPLTRYMTTKYPDRSTREWNEIREDMHRQVVNSAGDVIALKGYTSWAVGYSVANIIHAIKNNTKSVKPVSICAKGMHGIEEEVFLSLPCVLGRSGMEEICPEQVLSAEEVLKLHKSVKALKSIQDSVMTEEDLAEEPPAIDTISIHEEPEPTSNGSTD
eukprot:CAMPEP_0117665284 /NCGR_PEP_ID=MMETSP0804-20121206/9726_1 /TAXON_ID=1074897 /ORGANISM="Tetraselmis astigmatica, Strain CCMP880" /LENGTH=427 /DNA_ID=CAMNT_0005472683 /DNA_START=45 /DNA_END=1328 /DNA_ORIENTATION=+